MSGSARSIPSRDSGVVDNRSQLGTAGSAAVADRVRMHYVDVARAIAILWMLADHFVAVVLSKHYRDVTDPVYASWAYLRGFTAPLFFTVSGFVFASVLRAERPLMRNPQVSSLLGRVLQCWVCGYALQLSIFGLLRGHLSSWFYVVHVLQSMAVGWLILLLCYALHCALRRLPLAACCVALGFVVFVATPVVRAADYARWPLWIGNYFTADHGSVFPLFPWAGFVLFGGALGATVAKLRDRYSHRRLGGLVLLVGGALLLGARPVMDGMAEHLSGLAYLASAWRPRHCLVRLGEVTALLGALMVVEQGLCARLPLWFRRVGQRTLSIYVAHAVLLYGSVVGIGIDSFCAGRFTPAEVALWLPCFAAPLILLAQWRAPFGRWGSIASAMRPMSTSIRDGASRS